ncbi:MAG: LptF/LptG family permease [Muribaculaceae bacterium]|nr:LptF/LptG family permease [Muribaculaceae bacterium]
MRVIKKLHLFVLKSFLPLFAMTFFIVLFIVLMQFLWRYIDDLVGKGLGMGVIAELFFYAAVSMVPMALPLAILLASLMTFGNLGERFELTAMKAAGISLLRVMAPLIILIGGIAVGAFFFQNNVLPKAQVKMWTLLFSMRQKSPEVEIPEKVFYDQIPGINLYVSHKGKKNGMLYDVKIYDVRRGGENVTILVSDSARMALTEDMQYIYLYMYAGNQYERMSPSTSMRNDPFRREAFDTKEILIPFDNNFNRLDEGGMREQYVGKNLAELQHTIDSVGHRVDSMGQVFTTTVAMQFGEKPDASQALSGSPSSPAAPVRGPAPRAAEKAQEAQTPHIEWMGSLDSLINSLGSAEQSAIFAAAVRDVEYKRNSIMFDAETIAQEKKVIRRHGIELLKKFTLSVACLIFFFIGAPLGAIIRKGGIGAPLVISVLLFLVYYIIDNTGYKMARDGHAEVWLGMWLSTFVLAPLGIFVTYKAMTDSAVFDPDKINLFFRRLRGKREERNLLPKEVIIEEVSGEDAFVMLMRLDEFCDEVSQRLGRSKLLIGSKMVPVVKELDDEVDAVAEYLHNSRDPKVVALLNRLPILRPSRFMRKRTLSRDIASIKSVIAKLLGLQ